MIIREAAPGDQAYVAATLTKQLEQHEQPNALADRIFDSANIRIWIAESDTRILGWLVCAKITGVRALLYVYVRRAERGHGVARMLANTAWPARRGQWVHGGLRGQALKSLLERYRPIEMSLKELL